MEINAQKSAFEETFKKHANAANILTVTQGAQFGVPGAAILFLANMGILVFAVFFAVQGRAFVSAGLFVTVILLISYIADFRGFQVDFQNQQVRVYRSYFGFKYGAWFLLADFDTIELYQDKLIERKSIYGRAGTGGANDTNYFYFVSLTDTGNNRRIVVYESDSYVVSYVFAKKMAERTGLSANLQVQAGDSEYIG